ncbi:beta-ketoacyl-ACP reductase [Salinispira pacifica]|uniref:3-oxoacyl-[acyl-carrier protein] reductase n=1 Tax=Salinispira pacifica TaxID=1307761 RepID=V5WI86_9SPIO|nr:beta-ketoacyl-ACP reductase [Salinispira pacifica]AHC15345.1 3-oxoacyl-[acyl-carrier protein] reductase [Salinispira pacifica]
MNLDGKVCIITGGARGIGRKIVETMAEAGAKAVYALDMAFDGFDEVTKALPNVKSESADVTKSDAVKTVVEKIWEAEGRIDVLVNNAGITRDNLIQKMSDDDWNAVISVNLTGVFNLTREIGPRMMNQGSGSIINMASIVGEVGNVGQSNYAATKGGVISMAKTWAKEFARKGAQVRSNAIAPGFIRTPMTEKMPQKVLDAMVGKTTLGRMGEPEDIANAALFLASDASSFITGQVLSVNGGLTL